MLHIKPLITLLLCLMLKSQPSRVSVLRASRAICPCDKDTNDDPDRNDTGSCCHSCKWLLQVLVPLCITPLYPGGLIFLIRSQPRLQDVKMILLAVQHWRRMLTTCNIMWALQKLYCKSLFRILPINNCGNQPNGNIYLDFILLGEKQSPCCSIWFSEIIDMHTLHNVNVNGIKIHSVQHNLSVKESGNAMKCKWQKLIRNDKHESSGTRNWPSACVQTSACAWN